MDMFELARISKGKPLQPVDLFPCCVHGWFKCTRKLSSLDLELRKSFSELKTGGSEVTKIKIEPKVLLRTKFVHSCGRADEIGHRNKLIAKRVGVNNPTNIEFVRLGMAGGIALSFAVELGDLAVERFRAGHEFAPPLILERRIVRCRANRQDVPFYCPRARHERGFLLDGLGALRDSSVSRRRGLLTHFSQLLFNGLQRLFRCKPCDDAGSYRGGSAKKTANETAPGRCPFRGVLNAEDRDRSRSHGSAKNQAANGKEGQSRISKHAPNMAVGLSAVERPKP